MIDAFADPVVSAVTLALSYLLGSVPFGLVLTRLFGAGDIRKIGSGNIGATNVLRTGRKDLALATLLLDAGKGGLAVALTQLATGQSMLAAMAGAAAFMGHCYPVFLRFQGGKGVATFMGTLVAIDPLIFMTAAALWVMSAFFFRISSLSALIAAALSPTLTYFFLPGRPAVVLLLMATVIVIRHRDNISRLIAGTEPKIGAKK